MQALKENKWILGISFLFVGLIGYIVFNDQAIFALAPLALIAIFFAIYYTEYAFLGIAFLTPLSVNIEEYTDGIGLYLPTEPILFGLMLMLVMMQLRKAIIPVHVWRNPIVWAVGFYLLWTLVTSITSSNPTASFKFLLARLWFIVPLLLFGPRFAKSQNQIVLNFYSYFYNKT